MFAYNPHSGTKNMSIDNLVGKYDSEKSHDSPGSVAQAGSHDKKNGVENLVETVLKNIYFCHCFVTESRGL